MFGRIVRWLVWLLVASAAISYMPVLLRLDRDALATLGVFVLCAASFIVVGRIVYSRGSDRDDEAEFLLWRQNADRFRE
ncbi:MAG: hypothetical protein JHD15_03300 [Phenylobacterium sp.]|jgi:FtsH-binding integral membrane protein|uniref:hypothetical protein n=1 Tax=Phenylobacterium sp. TaxID=1871053 RepID=UPI001A28FFC2|nr:hypothetical protein [Phenylobacterium sp.]MBJ7409377.1 hypothetical protein [Phenylobacterium sp.]